jgi:hypothetical protein
MPSLIEDLEKAGWTRVARFSPYWKAPDDNGPVGRKWSERDAHYEMTKRKAARAAERKAKAEAKKAAAETNG